LILGLAASSYLSTARFLRTAIRVPGSVVAISHDDDAYFPVIAYSDGTGSRHTFRSPVSSQSSTYAVGDAVTVYYSPAEPAKARLATFWSVWFATVGASILGVAMYLAAIGVWAATRSA